MTIKIGDKELRNRYVGDRKVLKVMRDGTEIWSAGTSELDIEFLSNAVNSPMRVVFAGSSTTQGYAVPRFENYTHVMMARLVRHVPNAWATRMQYFDDGVSSAVGNGFHFLNVGLGGTTSANYLNGARAQAALLYAPQLVIHMIGSNDYIQQMPIETYKSNLRNVINNFAPLGSNVRHLLVHTYRRRDRADTGITWAQYGEALEAVSREFDNVGFVDVSQAWEDRQAPGVQYMMADNIHATWQGNELLAHTVADAMGLQHQYGETIWAIEASSPNFTNGNLVPSSDSRVQLAATSPSSGNNVTKITSGGVSLINFSNSGARYADTPSWNQAVAFPLAFFAVIHDWGDGAYETNTAPFFSRSIANDDGWWWVWRMKNAAEYRAALNSAFSDPAIRSSTGPWIIGVHMTSNNRATVFINSLDPVAVLGPVSIDGSLGPWMKSLRLGANSSLGSYTSMRAREIRFTSAPIRPGEFMPDQMRALGVKYGRVLSDPTTLQGFQDESITARTLTRSVWTPLHSAKVVGSGNGRINLAWRFDSVPFNNNSHLRAIRLLHNGTVIGGWDHGGTKVMATAWQGTAVADRALQHNDTVVVEAYANSGASGLREVLSSSMSINPV